MKHPTPIEEPSEDYKQALYEIYKVIFKQRILLEHNRVPMMTTLFARQRWSWRVTAISTGALKNIAENDFRHSKGLQRDHFIQKRDTTFKLMLPASGKPLDYDAWWKLFWKNDATILVTKEEHYKTPEADIKLIKLNWKDGYFACKKLVGFNFRVSIEGAFLRQINAKISTSERKLISISQLKSELL